jgi:hypothetical protein
MNRRETMRAKILLICMLIICLSLAPNVCGQPFGDERQGKNELNWDNETLREEWTYTIGVQAYIWGYPLVSQYNRFIGVSKNQELHIKSVNGFDAVPGAPINHICFLSNYANPTERKIVAPNVDTLYGSTLLNLTKEPIVLRIPDMKDRYWIAEMCEYNTDTFASPGLRRGSKPGSYLIAGPGWNGTIPEGIVEVIRSPTNKTMLLFRVLMRGESDRKNVIPLINQITSAPMSEINNTPTTIDYDKLPRVEEPNVTPDWVPDVIFWEELRAAIKTTEHRENEKALIALFNQTGLGVSEDPAIIRGLNRALKDGKAIVEDKARFKNLGPMLNYGWTLIITGGRFGTDYLTRAAVADSFIYANLPEDSLYYLQEFDRIGEKLNGTNRYLIHFDEENLPPIDPRAFWSVTVYNEDYFLEEHPANRYNIGTVTEGLKYNKDGSLDVHLQYDKPEGNESNWLPVPKEPFLLVMRVYMPGPSALNNTYNPPPVVKVT